MQLGIVERVDTVTTENIVDEYPECFEGLGCLEREHEIRIDPKVKPVINRARRIPLAMTDIVKAELDKMEQMGVIAKVDEPTEWVNSMVVAEKKDGSVRICLDPKELNKAILREHHHIPTLEDIAHKFAGMKTFTIMDMKHAYWHVPLNRRSHLLTTFNTPFGRRCFLRLPFGIVSSAEVFEKRVEEIFGDLNVAIYFDDLIVFGKDQEDHDRNLRKLLSRAKEHNVKFNREKIQLNRSEVRYLGHIVSAEGLKPDPDKVQAIDQMPNPKDKLGIQRLLGTLNYLRGFIPDVSELTSPLRDLLKDDTIWSWDDEQESAMKNIRKALTSEPVLQYFDVNKDTTLQVDSSQSGLGAVLLQDNHPIAYASRALTETEQNWPQIDKELLAIVHGFEKFHSYVYGRPIDVQTDHNPLVSIIKKELHRASPRLQRLLLRLMKYRIKRVSYVPGKFLYLADTLSRAYIGDASGEMEEEVVMVHTVQVREDQKEALQAAYKTDKSMSDLHDAIQNGWMWRTKSQAPPTLQPYWSVRDELYLQEGFIYRGNQLVVPPLLRREYLKLTHKGHLGIQKCTERAKQYMFWPGISAEVREFVASCPTCQRFANQQQKEPLIPHEVPELPWNKVGMDIMELNNKNYLVVVDFFSHYPEVRLIPQKRGEDVVMALKSIFAVHGVPATVITDNMPFNSATMTGFAKDWGFTIITSSPHYHQSNGMAERYVQTIKQFLKKAAHSGEDLYEALLAYRQAPLTGLTFSPAEMLFNRCLRGPLPCTSAELAPSIPSAFAALTDRQNRQKAVHDRSARALEPLKEGSEVLMRINKQADWSPGQVINRHKQPRSYVVDNGTSLVQRNRVHLKPVKAVPEIDLTEPDDPTNTDTSPTQQAETEAHTSRVVNTPRREPRITRGQRHPKYADYEME